MLLAYSNGVVGRASHLTAKLDNESLRSHTKVVDGVAKTEKV